MADGNAELFERANRVIPGGVDSPVRAFGSVGGTPYFVARAGGPFVWDVDGRRYIDYVQSYGASILGHAHADVVAAVQQAAVDGSTYGAPTEREVLLAEAICERVGSGCDLVRLVSSGTEATMSAVRVARGFTARDRVVMFEGCYHGHSDGLLAAGGSGMATLGLPASAGVPRGAVADTVVVPYNDVPELDDDVACVIVEPVAANMGLVCAQTGFLEGLRAACDAAGALLIFDEVITGFRLARGGATSWTGVRPDLWTFGKVIGGGLPLAAFAGRRDVMSVLAPLGPVYQAGTLSGNPLATAAGLTVLDHLDAGAYTKLTETASTLAAGLTEAMAAAGVEAQVPVVGPLVGLFFGSEPVTDYDGAKRSADTGEYARFFHGMLDRGVAFAPGPYEIFFPSLAHGTAEIDATIEAAVAVAATLAPAG
ncbi:MAG: glutamate-semialdehyde -aminomutase [Actinomycetota bacterium]|jgi:glutamate-1-semialdehyde 2,1-aminomutase|nr:glutamate-semialdehyde -aminomutase [Actinomycetota bacterium]